MRNGRVEVEKRVQRDFYAGATISARLLRVYLRLSARPRILAGRRIAQARFEPEPCRRASGFAWPAVKSPLQPYGLSPPAKPRMPPEAARECAPAGLHECGPPISAIMFCLVEIKAVAELAAEHRAQLMNYLRLTHMKMGLPVNFASYPKATVEQWVL